MLRKKRQEQPEMDPQEQIRQEYAFACDEIDALACEALNKIEAHFWNEYRIRVRIGFELDGVPTNNESSAPSGDMIATINRDYIKQELPEDESVNSYDEVEGNVIDQEIADFEYNFLEYKIKTGALLPQKAVAAVPRARRIMQRIARDFEFGRFQFSRFEPTYNEASSVQPLRTNISLWRATGGGGSGEEAGWTNISGEELIRGHGAGKAALKVLEGGLLMLAPRESSYERFNGEIPSAPRFYYIKGRDQVNGESGQYVISFAGDHDHTKRIEHRLPCADARPALAAMVVMLSVSAGFDGKVSFANETGGIAVGDPKAPSYNPAREITAERKRAMRSFKPSARNACFAELKRIAGKALAEKLFKVYREFVSKQDAADELLSRDVQHAIDHDTAYADRMDHEALIRHLKTLCLSAIPKPEPQEGDGDEAPDPADDPVALAEGQLDKTLPVLDPYLVDCYAALGALRTAIWDLPLNERSDLTALRDIANDYAPKVTKAFDRLWDLIAEEDKLANATDGVFNMRDMGRIQMVAQYMSHFVLEQTLGDLVQPEHYALVLGDRNIYVLKEEARNEATAYVTQFIINTMLAPRKRTYDTNMLRAFDTVARLYQTIYGSVRLRQGSDTAMDGMTRFLFALHKEAERFKGIHYTDEKALQMAFGTKFMFVGKGMTSEFFVNEIAPELDKLGFGKGTS